ncbi:SDR family oxidoreductase [Limnohabitans sp. Rim8]|uniref:SDR family NAD(P)-dependent oxidoreductase n=1 Tax=Limnohabitans sp. Rim8 TaxID=1100718 RepID=UPI003306422E
MSAQNMEGQTALITGGAQGIGKAIAALFIARGGRVVIADINAEAAEATAKELSPSGRATWFALDLMDLDMINNVPGILDTASVGPVHVLVNNAGILDNVSFLDTNQKIYDDVMNVNFRGPFFLTQQIANRMRHTGGGAIVNIASASGLLGNQERPVYGPAKAGIIALTKCLAVELAKYRIRVNAVAPGAIATPLTAAGHSKEVRSKVLLRTPLNRYGLPEEVAAAVVFLASADASFITGHTLAVDGGFVSAGFFESPLSGFA